MPENQMHDGISAQYARARERPYPVDASLEDGSDLPVLPVLAIGEAAFATTRLPAAALIWRDEAGHHVVSRAVEGRMTYLAASSEPIAAVVLVDQVRACGFPVGPVPFKPWSGVTAAGLHRLRRLALGEEDDAGAPALAAAAWREATKGAENPRSDPPACAHLRHERVIEGNQTVGT